MKKDLFNNEEVIEVEVDKIVDEPIVIEEENIEEVVEEPEFKGITIGKVIGGFLNLRTAPSKDADVIAIMPEETQIYFKGEKECVNGFVKVRAEEFGLDGFVMEQFIAWDEE